jgi:hypothetical protein
VLNISLAGLIGAVVGTFIAGVNYHLFIGVLERWMRDREQALRADEFETLDSKLSLVRRTVLTLDLFAFAVVGYWLGMTLWD